MRALRQNSSPRIVEPAWAASRVRPRAISRLRRATGNRADGAFPIARSRRSAWSQQSIFTCANACPEVPIRA
ncbi:hypothetical protein [Altererythrobacter sp. CC-YST694]|uniref:VHL beta domain-containing protein n=1 Tax=Altererythrobacter sp. CC-YST694 TaxID=2755038 RepID=UPI001D029C5E